VQEAEQSGASRTASCDILSLNIRRLERWEKRPEIADQRRGPIANVAHALTVEEKNMIIEVSGRMLYRDLSPWQIVAKMADLGVYIASESSFYRVLRHKNLLSHRSKAQPATRKQPMHLIARNPNEVWSWDITYLKTQVKGMYYYLYLIEDIFSRKIVGSTVEESESADYAAELIERICREQNISRDQLKLHSDNGGPMKGATMLAKLQDLGVMPSFSRPSVSNDNPYSESLFKTLKYRPTYPDGAFAGLEEAREWVRRFIHWYNTEHLHSGIRFVTPSARHNGEDALILQKREAVYQLAKAKNPLRWSSTTRNWNRVKEVHLNPKKEVTTSTEVLRNQAA
jgi:putative transposase